MIDENEIKMTALESTSKHSLTVSSSSVRVVPKNTISVPDSTQHSKATVDLEKLTIIPNELEMPEAGVSAHDVAAFILQQRGEMTAMKLQKLVYYSQAWSLVWDETPLFNEAIEAWANGPVVRSLYAQHQGQFRVSEWNGDPSKLTANQRETVLKVLEFYGPMPAQVLSELTHSEGPWIKARNGLAIGERGSRVISHADMVEYYSSLVE